MFYINNEGLDQIQSRILQKIKKWNINNDLVITNQRHYEALINTLNSIEAVNRAISSNISGELLAIDIKALQYLGEITGEITNEHLLDSIFKDFCIGK